MTEDKQAILKALCATLQLTRAGKDTTELIYDKEDSEKCVN